MTSNIHIFPIYDTGGNINYTPYNNNITDKSLISVYWSDIIYNPLSNISVNNLITSNVLSDTSNQLLNQIPGISNLTNYYRKG